MDVADCDACWTMIRDMNVRGAPAIAIAAALALAVDLEASKAGLSTSAEVCAFVAGKLDHLFTSRPTAVNLGEAVQRLKASASALRRGGRVWRGRGGADHRGVRGHAGRRRRGEPRDRRVRRGRAVRRRRQGARRASTRADALQHRLARHRRLRHGAGRGARAPRERPSRTHLLQRDAPVQPGRAAHRVRDCVREDARDAHLRLGGGEPDAAKGGRRRGGRRPRRRQRRHREQNRYLQPGGLLRVPRRAVFRRRARVHAGSEHEEGGDIVIEDRPAEEITHVRARASPPTASASGTPPSTSPPGA